MSKMFKTYDEMNKEIVKIICKETNDEVLNFNHTDDLVAMFLSGDIRENIYSRKYDDFSEPFFITEREKFVFNDKGDVIPTEVISYSFSW